MCVSLGVGEGVGLMGGEGGVSCTPLPPALSLVEGTILSIVPIFCCEDFPITRVGFSKSVINQKIK